MDMRYVFVGNRRFVLLKMLENKLELVAVMVVQDSDLQRDLEDGVVPGVQDYLVVSSKIEVLKCLPSLAFDILVSNGCPYILPIEQLPAARYVNIHQSYLPDLRGVDPVIGSVLHARDAGATCHVMDDGIDTGPIISQVRIPYTEDLDVTTMYQLSFIAEQRAFSEALAQDFEIHHSQQCSSDDIYYSRRPEDRQLNFRESNDVLLRKVKAFNNRSQGCEFSVQGRRFRVYSAVLMRNSFLEEVVKEYPEGVVALSYENCIVFHKDGEVLRLLDVVPETGGQLIIGDRLFG